MESYEDENTFSAATGLGSRSDRHGEGVDPALPGSSSQEGPTASLPAGLAENVASADDIPTRRLRSCASRTSVAQCSEEDLGMDTESLSVINRDAMEDIGSDDDAKSCVSLASNISTATTRSVDRKRKHYDSDSRTPAGKRRQEEGSSIEAPDFKEPVRQPLSAKSKALSRITGKTQKTEEELSGMTITDLRSSALEWIDHIEQIRKNSGNLQGRLSGIIKDRLISLGDIVRCLAEKAEERGDPIYHKMQSKELTAKIKCLEKEEAKWKVERNRYENEILALTKKNEEIEAKLWAADRNLSTPNTAVSKKALDALDKEWPALRPPIQGVRKVLTTSAPIQAPISTKPIKGSEDLEIDSITKEIKKLLVKKKQMIKTKGKKGTDREYETETEGEDRVPQKDKPKPKLKPKIISNIQLAPPRPPAKDGRNTDDEEWFTKKTKKKEKDYIQKNRYIQKSDPNQARVKKVPKTAAVTITAKKGISYAEILRHAREKISLPTMGIDASKIRKGINGGLIIEISGEENNIKAAKLADKLKEVLPDKDNIRIAQPTIKADLKISGLDDSISKQEIVDVIANLGTCNSDDIKAGDIRWLPNGLGAIWVRCPANTANTVAASGKIKVGWTIAKIEILPSRPLQCYRCWNYGHVRYSCTSPIDRSNHCYRCGNSDHRINDCSAPRPRCIICEEKGRNANHRLGSTYCDAINNAGKHKPIPRIRGEELKAKNKNKGNIDKVDKDNKDYNGEYSSNDPDRRTTDMDVEDVIS